MNGLDPLTLEQVRKHYFRLATSNIDEYCALVGMPILPVGEKRQYIEKTYKFSSLLKVENNVITRDSLRIVESKASKSKGFEEQNLQLKLLELFLACVEKQSGIRSAPLSHFAEIRQEQPILTPAHFLDSTFHCRLYEHLEHKSVIKRYLSSPATFAGVLFLWLVLKEGIDKLSTLKNIVSPNANLFRIDGHCFYDVKQTRFWLSPYAELLLTVWYRDADKKVVYPMKAINHYLQECHLLTRFESITFAVLQDAMKVEMTLTGSALDYAMSSGMHKSAYLSKEQLVRLICNRRPVIARENEKEATATVRQKRSWNAVMLKRKRQAAVPPSVKLKDAGIQEQMDIVNQYTRRLRNGSRRELLTIKKGVLGQLNTVLQDREFVAGYPWCWLLLCWLYKLIGEGGKHKKHLKLQTVHSYISYVQKPFLMEFSGCDIHALEGIDWAEKLNIVADNVHAPTKKNFVIYFAQFLIENGYSGSMCESDLDIPTLGAKVNVNLISLREADIIIGSLIAMRGSLAQITLLVFCFGFFSGLRRGEVSGLQFADFHYNESLSYFNLHVRPNHFRELKSPHSARNIPLDTCWSESMLNRLAKYLKETQRRGMGPNSLIFPDKSVLDNAFNQLTRLMQEVTGDPTMRYHNNRDSFCNWNFIRLHKTEGVYDGPYPFLHHDFFSNKRCQALRDRIGIDISSRKKLWALSGLLGHASPETSLNAYFHLADFCRRAHFANHLPSKDLHKIAWGSRYSIDEWGRALELSETHSKLLPNVFESEETEKPIDVEAIFEDITKTPDGVSDDVSMSDIWRIVRRHAEGYGAPDISVDLKIAEDKVSYILESEKDIAESAFKTDKSKLPEALGYHRLTRNEMKVFEALIKRFMTLESSGNVLASEYSKVSSLIHDLVRAKDSLIRTTNHEAVRALITVMQKLGLSSNYVKLRWYYPGKEQSEQISQQRLRDAVRFWQKDVLIQSGFDKSCLEIVVPKGMKNQIADASQVTVSDEAKYLNFRDRGYVSVHTLMPKRKTAKRNRLFISFLRLLTLYARMNVTG
ncbi:hypothetical protein CS022_20270 [Veronia nyctiphanis]|uniref:Tyr recombinase domain-containing protein n=1 Tax=Veronia nyctiphanis TaxID=1278244 RepID=A0A4Q0YLV8_9GAMM|nr:hypothetical protein [Veronia nyctiphanis]RXJ71676.1 hypothetical protein CS022_20270 [Veronia nyctiphanis]